MDLVAGGDGASLVERRACELQAERESGAVPVTVFGTSTHDETLYSPPPRLRHSPHAFLTFALLHVSGRRAQACRDCAHHHPQGPQRSRPVQAPDDVCPSLQRDRGHPVRTDVLPRYRHFRPSRRQPWRSRERPELKALRHSCARMREELHALELELLEFTAVPDGMTRESYVLLIVDPTIGAVCFANAP
jgi:Ras-related GTP-binding protein A/B